MTRLESLLLRSAFACAHHRRLQVVSDGQTIGKNDGETGMVGDLVGCGEMTGMDKALGLLMDNRTNCLNVPTREAVICRINAGTGSSVGVEEEADGPLVVERIEVIEGSTRARTTVRTVDVGEVEKQRWNGCPTGDGRGR